MFQNKNKLNTATVVFSDAKRVSGGRTVIDHSYPLHRVTNGALIVNAPAVGEMIYEGDLGEFDFQTNTVKHLRVFVVAVAAVASATEIIVKAGDGYHVPKANDIVMIAPTNFVTGNGTAKTIQTVAEDANGLKITLDAAIGEVAEGDLLVIGATAGSTKAVAVVPNTVFTQDVYIERAAATTYNGAGARYSVPLYDACAILGSKLITPIPAGAKASLRSGYSDVKVVE